MSQEYSLGLGKTIFNSSVALIPVKNVEQTEIAITERFNRTKNSGAWPERTLTLLKPIVEGKTLEVRENRDVQTTLEFETYYNSRIPFVERMKNLGLSRFSTMAGPIHYVSHHEAHAYGALLFSPFDSALLMILDGAGTKSDQGYECLSLYRWKDRKLDLLDKKYLTFIPSKIQGMTFSEGIGLFYESVSEFIFNTKTEAGKVMGLAPFGKSSGVVKNYTAFLENLDWSKRYQGKSKAEWQSSPHMRYYQNLAATVQENFEHFLMDYLKSVQALHQEENLILTGGCALNCTFNGKLARSGMFKKIFIPPNPGDESISLGCAASFLFETTPTFWSKTPWEKLTSSRGLHSSVPTDSQIQKTFASYEVSSPIDLIDQTAKLLHSGEIVAWVQGRSEVGPRALGNRSILASPTRKNLKQYLNQNIKFREEFRPYGCTVTWEKAHQYFDIAKGFENPFMSFAVPMKSQYSEILKDVGHVDGTSRMQTLHAEQNPKYHSLLSKMEELNGLPILLNTSLNVMNEPIVETVEDAERFLATSKVDYMVIGDFLIKKKENSRV